MIRKKLMTVLLCMTTGLCMSQVYYKIGYSGPYITHPGFVLGGGRTIHNKIKENGTANELRAEMALGFYFHRGRHNAIYISPSLEWVQTKASGFQWGVSLPVGLIKTFVPNTYSVKNGEVARVKSTGPSFIHFMPGFRLGHKTEGFFFDEWAIKNSVMIIPNYPLKASLQHMFEVSVTKKIN